MQKLYLKKVVDLDHQLKELFSISVDESIHYKMEDEGMHALGAIIINGEYKNDSSICHFDDSIDLDILATFDKIIDKRDFQVKVEDFDYNIIDGNLSLVIQAHIEGVKDDDDRMIETNVNMNDDVVKEIEDLLRKEDSFEKADIINENIQSFDEEIEEDMDDDIGTYYLYVINDGDTYQSIGEHYGISEDLLKDYNQNRSLVAGTIIIVPYIV